MTKQEALTILSAAPSESSIVSALNRGITQAQAVEIVAKAVRGQPEHGDIPDWLEKRVRQMEKPTY